MSNQAQGTALVPVEQREIELSGGDRVVAALVEVRGEQRVYIPVRPICEALGVNWPSQTRRIYADEVLKDEVQGVVIMTTPSPDGRGGGPQTFLSLPLESLHGWLFGFQVSRVKQEYQETLLRYKRECYRVLYEAFYGRVLALRVTGVEQRVDTLEQRMDSAALVVGALRGDVQQMRRLLGSGQTITEAQAAEISQQVKALATLLAERDPSKNHFQGIWGEINRRFEVATYRNIPAARYGDVLAFLADWRLSLTPGA